MNHYEEGGHQEGGVGEKVEHESHDCRGVEVYGVSVLML